MTTPYTLPTGHVLVLRVNNPEGDKSYNDWAGWPQSGPVEAPDWRDDAECGGGLHGWLWGVGSVDVSDWHHVHDAPWRVVEVRGEDVRDLDGKVKFPRGVVVFCGNRTDAVDFILKHGAKGQAVNYATVTGGNYATVTGGKNATVTGGDNAKVTGGNYATVTGGYGATVTGGNYAKVTGGNYATVTGGNYATVTGGYNATVTGGYNATVTGGENATVTGGNYATVTGGKNATVTGGDNATVTGGYNAVLQLSLWDRTAQRRRIKTAYVGEDGIKPGVAYKLDASGSFVEANP